MKKLIAMLLALVMVMAMVACGAKEPQQLETLPEATPEASTPVEEETQEATEAETEPELTVMSHDEYMAAELDAEVLIETYVQDTQSWWFDDSVGHGKITLYCQDEDGAYFVYELNCSEEDAAKLVPGTKIRVHGYKAEWAGEVAIMDGTFEFLEADELIMSPVDYTDLLGTDEMLAHQNEMASFTGLTVEEISYKNGEPGDDIYLTLGKDGNSYSFCVEVYLTGTDSEVYTSVGELQVGDVVDVECFLYWYEGMNPHITGITKI